MVKSRNEEKMPVRFLFMKQNEAAAKEKYSMKSWTSNTLVIKGLALQNSQDFSSPPFQEMTFEGRLQ